MLKLIGKIGLVAYATYLWKINQGIFKKITLFLVIVAFSVFFYADLRELLREINPSYLIHALVFKWLLILVFSYLIYKCILKINWKFSGKNLFKIMADSHEVNPELKEKLQEIENMQKIELDLSKYRDIKKYPKLKSEIEQILKEY